MPRRYLIDTRWNLLLSQIGLSGQDILRASNLPLDLFERDNASINSEEYFRLWRGIEIVADEPLFPLKLVTAMSSDTFSPAIFATLCSENLSMALARLQTYKPLIGPAALQLELTRDMLTVQLDGLPGDLPPPNGLIAAEIVFFTHIARLGTREEIRPISIESPVALNPLEEYVTYLGCDVMQGDKLRVSFSSEDATRPFLTASAAMWSTFEPALQARLGEMCSSSTMSERVRAWLNENIASGRNSISEAARDLGVSSRTLQRRLTEEGTSYKEILGGLREQLSRHYLTQTNLPAAEIAFLLGYKEQSSFYRAFNEWTGTTPDRLRSAGSRIH